MNTLHATLTAAGLFLAAALSQSALAQPAPTECGGYGGRACSSAVPAGPIGDAAGPAFGASPGSTAAYGGGADAGAVRDETTTGFSWQRRDQDGNALNCRRGLDGTPRCDPPGTENRRRY